MGEVLVVGSSNTDLVCRTERIPRTGETVWGSSFATFGGGKGANQAIAASRAGATVRFVGAVGADEMGRQRLDDLNADGIDTSRARVIEGIASGVALITVEASGNNSIVIVPGANGLVTATDAVAAVVRGTHAVLSLTLEIPLDAVRAAIEANRRRGSVVLNAAPFDQAIREMLSEIDVLVLNEIEASELARRPVTPASATHIAGEIRDMGASAVAITLGAKGAVLSTRAGTAAVAAPSVVAVDSTGAGDAFCGAVAAWIADGASLVEAVRAGVCAGSLAVTRAGAQPSLPRWPDIVDLLETMGAA